jgi:hypothetical protein
MHFYTMNARDLLFCNAMRAFRAAPNQSFKGYLMWCRCGVRIVIGLQSKDGLGWPKLLIPCFALLVLQQMRVAAKAQLSFDAYFGWQGQPGLVGRDVDLGLVSSHAG